MNRTIPSFFRIELLNYMQLGAIFNIVSLLKPNYDFLHGLSYSCMPNVHEFRHFLLLSGLWILWWMPEEIWECKCLAILHWCFWLSYFICDNRWDGMDYICCPHTTPRGIEPILNCETSRILSIELYMPC